jgi:glutamate:GABA antiporter
LDGGTAIAFTNPNIYWDEALASNKHYVIFIVLFLFWTAIAISLKGIGFVAKIAKWAGLFGVIIPTLLLSFFGLYYYFSGRQMYLEVGWKDLFPDFSDFGSIVLATGVFLSYAGVEMNAIHVKDVDDAARKYPLAILISAAITVFIYTLGTLSIALIIQPGQIDLTQSLFIAFRDFFRLFDIYWLSPLIAIALAAGAFGSIAVWVFGPSTALVSIGQAGYLPPYFHQLNSNGVPKRILYAQGVIVTLLSVIFILLPTVQSAFQILHQLSTMLYLMMYLLMFAAAIRLRYTQPDTVRPYRVLGGTVGMWMFAGSGFISCFAAFILCFVPPSQVAVGNPIIYTSILICGFVISASIPLTIFAFRKSHWKNSELSIDFEPFRGA